MKLLSCLTILTALFVSQAQALPRGTVGNGGDVLVCNINGNYTYTILDHHEGEEFYKLKYDFPQKTTWKEILEEVIVNRLQKYSPARASRYLGWLDTFMDTDQIDFVVGKTLNDVPDSNHISIPNNCALMQIAIQRSEKELKWGGKRYTINNDLWVKLDERQKAVLVLHEIILREAILNEHENSIPSRYLNSYLFSKIHLEISADAVYKELERVFVGGLKDEIKSLPFGSSLVQEKVLFVMDKSGSNSTTDPLKEKRKTAFMNTLQKYFSVNYEQALVSFNSSVDMFPWTENKFSIQETYMRILDGKDQSGSNTAAAMSMVSRELMRMNPSSFERMNVVIITDGEPTVGDTTLEGIFRELINISKAVPVKFHFVVYGEFDNSNWMPYLKELGAKVYSEQDLGNIEF